MDSHNIQRIQQWVMLDNKISAKKKSLDEIHEEKKSIEKEILDYILKNNYDGLHIKINDGVIKFRKRTQQQSMSQKFIKLMLEKYNDENTHDKINISKVYDHILNGLSKSHVYYIKREINKDANDD